MRIVHTMRSRRPARWSRIAIASIFPLAIYACGLQDGSIVEIGAPASDASAGADSIVDSPDGASPRDANGDDSNVTDNDGGTKDSGVDAGPSKLLIYANTQTDLFSFDVVSSTLTHVATLSSCGSNSDDLAMDGVGQLYLIVKNDAIYQLAMSGTCSGRNVLSSNAGDDLRIAARAAGTPSIVAVDTGHPDYFSIDPLSSPKANVTTLKSGEFTANPQTDVACSQGGTCWTTLDHNHCSGAGSTESCLYSFPADGSATATGLGAINSEPVGLAYAGGALYGFNGDGTIDVITLGATPTASAVTVTLAGGTTQPSTWLGAASSSANP